MRTFESVWNSPKIDKQAWLDLDTAISKYRCTKWYQFRKRRAVFVELFKAVEKVLQSNEMYELKQEQALTNWSNERIKSLPMK